MIGWLKSKKTTPPSDAKAEQARSDVDRLREELRDEIVKARERTESVFKGSRKET